MRVLVTGSRDWSDPNAARKMISDRLFDLALESGDPSSIVIVHGAARGADRFAHQEAQKAGLLVEPHPADWERHGKSAGFRRNAEMVSLGADLCLAFWNGKSNGAKHTIDLARNAGIPVEVIQP